ncbi:MAG: UDP-N-acetylmuramoyl-L-alanine--D-glutamate ligase [Deferrisomatales bacterium]
MELRHRRAFVAGAGISGRAAARFLLARGARVTLYDDRPRPLLAPEVDELERAGATIAGPDQAAGAYDLVVVSPGVPREAPPVQTAAREGAEVIGELELAFRFLGAPVIAVTGTNGKTTVTEMVGRILRAAGRRTFVGGNVGTPLVEAVGGSWDWVVAEVSSFQLETVSTFRPRVAVLLNVGDDHLDRHRDAAAYGRAKGRIFDHQGPGDVAVVNRDDPAAWALSRRSAGTLAPFSTCRVLPLGAWIEGGDAVFLLPGEDGVRLPLGPLRLPGLHNRSNALAASLAAVWAGVAPEVAWRQACGFPGLPHRLEMFLEWRGARFVDDSKATNVGAALAALATVEPPVVWVGGGTDKGGDYAPLATALRERARLAVVVGAQTERLARALTGAVPLHRAADWPEGVRAAVAAVRPGDTVLLSPACASFDCFAGYAQRGETFQRLCNDETRRIDTERSGARGAR